MYGEEGLHDGDVVEVDGLELRVVGTPGHTSDSLSFVLPEDERCSPETPCSAAARPWWRIPTEPSAPISGHCGGCVTWPRRRGCPRCCPGHGPVLDDALGALDYYLAHRAERLDQVREAVAAGAVEPMDVVRRVYADVDERLWPAAELSVRAQLDYLREQG